MITEINQAYNVLMQIKPDTKDLNDAMILYISELSILYEKSKTAYLTDMVEHIKHHSYHLPSLITEIHKKRVPTTGALEYDELLTFLHGYSIYDQHVLDKERVKLRRAEACLRLQ